MTNNVPVRKITECPKFKIAEEFLRGNDWPVLLSDKRFNRCYCSICYPSELEDTYVVGGHTYVVPRRFVRIGVRIDEAYAKHLNIWTNWANCYHGTSIKSAKSVIEHRQLLLPGEETMDGKVISIRTGHIPGENYFFTTPSINYASLPQYAGKHEFRSRSNKKYYNVTVVLQCKQKPNSFEIQRETVGANAKSICPFIKNSEMEWKSRSRSSIIPYGMLLLVEQAGTRLEAISRRGIDLQAPKFAPPKDCALEWKQVECPHCYTLKDWMNPKYNQGVVLQCKSCCCKAKFKAFNCPHCTSLFTICGCFEMYSNETFFPCNNEKCGKKLMSVKCPHCPDGINYCKTPVDFQAQSVMCVAKSCKTKMYNVFQCPHCGEVKTSKSVVGKEGVIVTCSGEKCSRKYQLALCPSCSSVNVCPNAYMKVGRNDVVTCKFKICGKSFRQPLQRRTKA